MKICIMAWEMLETGGIIRVITRVSSNNNQKVRSNFLKNLELGHEVVTYLANKNGRLKISEDLYFTGGINDQTGLEVMLDQNRKT